MPIFSEDPQNSPPGALASAKFLSPALPDDLKSKSSNSAWVHEPLAQVRIKVIRGHEGPVNTCQFVDHDHRILTASNDLTARLWNAETGEELQQYKGHQLRLSCAHMNQESSQLVTGAWDKKVHLWDAETGAIVWTADHVGMVTSCNFSHDGQLVISGTDLEHLINIWDVRTGHVVKELKDLHSSTITNCAFSPLGDRIITSSMDQTTKFYDLKSDITTLTLRGHINVISNFCITPDERNFATCSWDKTIQLWDVSTGMYRSKGGSSLTKGHEGSISACNFSQDSSMLVSAGYDTSIIIWDLENSIQKIKLMGHEDWVEDVCFSQDGSWILSCSKDSTIRLWNIEDSDQIPMAVENKKSIGLRIIKCNQCGKPFSMAQLTDAGHICVFCRIQERSLQSSPTIDFEAD